MISFGAEVPGTFTWAWSETGAWQVDTARSNDWADRPGRNVIVRRGETGYLEKHNERCCENNSQKHP